MLESYAWMSTGAGVGATDGSGSLSSDSEPGGVEGSSSWPSYTGGRADVKDGVLCGVARRDDDEASGGGAKVVEWPVWVEWVGTDDDE